ncbi:serine/threonine protein phosphatase PrpC [Flavobacteriaceae bacterium MAR_2010_105]|nr:serine/threonine protein phosphatase PrpC [Flavobacteriaceae bacterium MAR_2010_105]
MIKQSIFSSATITNKTENQDDHGCFRGQNFNSLFVADGLGSFQFAKLSSARVINFIKKKAESFELNNNLKNPKVNYPDLFRNAKDDLIGYSNQYIIDNEIDPVDFENLFGTTLITLYETDVKIGIAYVGNGAIWHIRGCFNSFPEPYLIPWNAVNLLNPHSLPEDGKEALYRLISNSKNYQECIPTVLEINKDREFGDIIMICSDGISSIDQLRAGSNDKGIWVKYETFLIKLFEQISDFFLTTEEYTDLELNKMLIDYLEELKPEFDDDATIGVLMTSEVLEYQRNLKLSDEINQNSEI